MLRINRLLRTSQICKKAFASRGGPPGWDRPDVPPSVQVPRQTQWTHEQLIYTFYHHSQPEFILTQPQVFQGQPMQGLPLFSQVWAMLFGVGMGLYLFQSTVNPWKTYRMVNPNQARYGIKCFEKMVQEKYSYKVIKDNKFGIQINPETYPPHADGQYLYPPDYYRLKRSMDYYEKMRKQCKSYIAEAMERAKHPQTNSH